MQNLIYILSPEYSGSTAISMLIGTLPDCVGVGEVVNSFNQLKKRTTKRTCSCGAEPHKCEIWAPIADQCEEHPGIPLIENYAKLDETLVATYGPDYCMVDASKRKDVLLALRHEYGDKLKIISVTRDLRGYLHGRLSKENLRQQQRQRKLGLLFTHLPWWAGEALDWFRRTVGIHMFLKRNKFKFLSIGYDELGQTSECIEMKIKSFLGKSDAKLDFTFSGSQHHMLFGNKSVIYERDQATVKQNQIFSYDSSWKSQPLPFLCRCVVLLLRPINDRLVYSNSPNLRN